jgi:hypothetical protein
MKYKYGLLIEVLGGFENMIFYVIVSYLGIQSKIQYNKINETENSSLELGLENIYI